MSNGILLLRSGSVLSKGRVGSVTSGPPLGIAYLAACLRKDGFDVQVIDPYGEDPHRLTSYPEFDIQGLPNEEVVARVPAAGLAMVGFSCMFSNEWIYLKELIRAVRLKNPTAVTVLGGEHASALPEYCLQSCPELDFVIRGEGETPIVEFANRLIRARGELHGVPGLTYRADHQTNTLKGDGLAPIHDGSLAGKIVHNAKSERIKALDEIPFPAWDLVPIENYLREGIATITSRGHRVLPMLASRGCPYACKFCSNPQMYGNRYFVRDVDRVIEEIEFLRDRFGMTGFELDDLTFIIKKPWVKEFCRKLLERGIHMEWNVPTTRSEAIDEEVVALLRESGCKYLCMTPDSGSPTMIDKMLKRVDLENIAHTVRVVLRSGIILKVNLVIGFPDERHRDVWQSIFYGMKLAFFGAHSVLFYRFTPYPGSEYFNQLQKEGMLPPPGPAFDRFLVTNIYNELRTMKSYSRHISDGWIRLYMFAGYALTQAAYYSVRPWELFRMVWRVAKRNPLTQSELLILGLIDKIKHARFAAAKTESASPTPEKLVRTDTAA